MLGVTDNGKVGKDLAYWRNVIFVRFLNFFLPIGLIVAIPSIIMSLKMGLLLIAGIDLIAYCTIVLISLNKAIPIKTKKRVFIGVMYFLSASLLLVMGLTGPGFIYLLGVSLTITLIISSHAGYTSVLANCILVLFFTFGSDYGWLGISTDEDSSIMSTLIIGANFLLINLVSVAAISFFLKGLGNTLQEDRFLRQKAEESDNLKSAFLANISHEIRTPLNAILGFSDLAMDPDFEESEREDFMNKVNSNGEQLLSIINSIVDISVIESGQMFINYSLFSLSDLMADCFKQIQNFEKSANVAIELQKCDEISITSDREKLIQVLTILFTNALKFTKKGKVSCNYYVNQDYATFNVSDTGIGIAPDIGDDLFQRFYKVENSNEFKSGTGLGLAISKGIIDVLGGEIWYDSEVGVGTDFYFTIPISNNN